MLIAWLTVCAALGALGALGARAHAAERLDGKVRFPEERDTRSYDARGEALAAPSDAEGFYSRARAGRYRVRVETQGPIEGPGRGSRDPGPYRVDPHAVYPVERRQYEYYRASDEAADGTLDALQYCKCVSTPECAPSTDLPNACGSGKILCCYSKKPNADRQSNSEAFNDINDDEYADRPYASDPYRAGRPGPPRGPEQPSVLAGPGGPTGLVGPQRRPDQPDVLTGPGGPTGIIGPQNTRGPTGAPAVLVGPGGPTGLIGPDQDYDGLLEELEREVLGASTAQRGVLVGPGGPTGIVGPQRGVLVGPGGPTGSIGPQGYFNQFRNGGYNIGGFGSGGYNNVGRPAVLVGPGGPTGQIGPRRPVLVGPGGPTGVVGPWYRSERYGGYGK